MSLFTATLLTTLPLLAAQAEDEAGRGYNLSWFIVLLCVILGLMVSLYPTKRDDKVIKAKED